MFWLVFVLLKGVGKAFRKLGDVIQRGLMKVVSINNVKEGEILGKNVLDETGQILLHAGVELRRSYIESLKAKGYSRLFIRDAYDILNVEPDQDLKPETRTKALVTLRNVYKAIEKETEGLRKCSLDEVRNALAAGNLKTLMGSSRILDQVKAVVSSVLDEVLTRATLAGLTSIKCTNSALYEHSIDVCVSSILVGANIGLSYHRMRQLAAGALLHDIGVIFLEKDLPERVRIRHHTQLGYELLRNIEDREILAPHVAYEHHEHQDGSGLPRGLVGSNTIARPKDHAGIVPTLVGEIAAVTNAYDNLLSGTGKTRPVAPDVAVQIIQSQAGTVFNREVVRAFLRVVPVYPKGTEIVVTEGTYHGYKGIVVHVNIVQLDKPVIALCLDKDGHSIDPIMVDLAKETDIRIRAIWNL